LTQIPRPRTILQGHVAAAAATSDDDDDDEPATW
jgi:hypothetical protein